MTEAYNEKKNLFLVGFALFVMALLTNGGQIAAGALFPELAEQGNSWTAYALMLIPQYCIAMPAAYLLLRLIPKTGLNKKRLSASQFFKTLLICYAILYVGNMAALVITDIIKSISGRDMENLVARMVAESDIFANLLAVGILGPVMEELFYRKLLIGRLLRYGDKAAVLTSGLIFGLVHGNLSQFFYAFGLGIAFGYIYIRTAKISYTIALHIFINTLSGIVAPLLVQDGDAVMLLYAMAMLAMAISGFVLFIINRRRIWFAEGICKLEKWPAAMYLNPGMILFFIVCSALFTLNTIAALL